MRFFQKLLHAPKAAQADRSLPLVSELLEPRMLLSSVQVLAAGTTGLEQIDFQVGGQTPPLVFRIGKPS